MCIAVIMEKGILVRKARIKLVLNSETYSEFAVGLFRWIGE